DSAAAGAAAGTAACANTHMRGADAADCAGGAKPSRDQCTAGLAVSSERLRPSPVADPGCAGAAMQAEQGRASGPDAGAAESEGYSGCSNGESDNSQPVSEAAD